MVANVMPIKAQPTHCRRGHLWTPENTYISKTSKKRSCRECMRAAGRVRDKKRREMNRRPRVARATATHCVHGHEWTPENTYWYIDGDGYQAKYCRACNRVSQKTNAPKHRDKVLSRASAGRLRRKYGLDEAFLTGKACGICGTTDFGGHRPTVDHDHACCPGDRTCGRCVRGVLCRTCNLGLGHIGEENLLRAVAYVENYHARRRAS